MSTSHENVEPMGGVQSNLLFKLSTRGSWKTPTHTRKKTERRTKVVTERALHDHDDSSKVFPVDLLRCISIKHKHAHPCMEWKWFGLHMRLLECTAGSTHERAGKPF